MLDKNGKSDLHEISFLMRLGIAAGFLVRMCNII